ncbi:MAG: EamA family transporter [Candidatus Woesearchaeota archaeon]
MATSLWSIGLVALATLVGSLGPIMLKKGAAQFNLNPLKQFRNYHMIGGIAIYALSTMLYIPALKGGELSVLYPLVSLGYIWTTLLAIPLLHERMNFLKWLGIGLIVSGTMLIGLGAG